jgi:hypothetical protein
VHHSLQLSVIIALVPEAFRTQVVAQSAATEQAAREDQQRGNRDSSEMGVAIGPISRYNDEIPHVISGVHSLRGVAAGQPALLAGLAALLRDQKQHVRQAAAQAVRALQRTLRLFAGDDGVRGVALDSWRWP